MDQFDRHSRQRLNEETARHRLRAADRDRDRARKIGYVEDGASISHLLLGIVIAILLVVPSVLVYLGFTQPSDQSPALADEPAWGTATDEHTLVQPPGWWLDEP